MAGISTVIVHPEPPEKLKELIREFLALADKATDVEFVMWPEPGVRVPEELFDKFAATKTPQKSESAQVEDTEKPVRRGPGRPKKIQEGQD